MEQVEGNWLSDKLRRIANETAELPVMRWLAQPLYRRLFRSAHVDGNTYCGTYATYAEARAAAPPTLPDSYDFPGASAMYRDQHQRIRVSDYPLVFWLGRLLAEGQRRIFDLGGHVGVSYYGFRPYLDYPADLHWLVHDMPEVVNDGREYASSNDPAGCLAFTHCNRDADGRDVLLTSGALQYLDYTLPELLGELAQPPRHVLVNLVPMHPVRSYFTLQNIGKAVLPYRVAAVPEFIAAMDAIGYTAVDQWRTAERHMRIPFEPAYNVDGYQGFYFMRR